MEPTVRIRYMNGPMPFDKFDRETGFIHATGREYEDYDDDDDEEEWYD